MKKDIKKDVNIIHRQLQIMLANYLAVIGLPWGLDQKINGMELILADQTDLGTNCWRKDDDFFRIRSSDISCLQCLWEKRTKKQRREKEVYPNIELLLRTVISADQLSVYGAVADSCDELSESFRALVKPKAPDYLDKTETPAGPSIA